MSYKSKRTIVSMLAGLVISIVYIMYAIGNNAPDLENIKAWATTILVFIGISVLAMIIIQILFHIGYSIGVAIKEQKKDDKEIERIIKSSMKEDEMEKLITLKTSHINFSFVGIGFGIALILLAIDMPVVYALHTMLGSIFLGATVEGFLSIYFFEKGVK